MEALLEYLKESRNVATLFVKRDNTSAIALYEKLSFRIRDNYRISYYAYT
jgi:ribosomal protein S18 acetylase RimI-like enzyme